MQKIIKRSDFIKHINKYVYVIDRINESKTIAILSHGLDDIYHCSYGTVGYKPIYYLSGDLKCRNHDLVIPIWKNDIIFLITEKEKKILQMVVS